MSCEQCTQGYVLDGEPEGTMVDGAYLRAAPSVEGAADAGTPKRAVVLLTDIFGLPLKNSKLVADEIARRVGCDVWVPDLFAPASPPFTVDELEPLMPSTPEEQMSILQRLRFMLLALPRAFRLFGIRAAVVDPRLSAFVAKIKAEKKYEKIGAVGYCFGGSMAIRFGATDTFNSVVIAHPGPASAEEVKAIKVPASWICAEADMSFKKPMRDQAEAIFAARKDKPDYVEYEFKDYKGTVHGFGVRPDLKVPVVAEAFKAALDQTCEWFKKTLV